MRRTIPMGSGAGNRPREQQSEQVQAAKPIPTRWQRRRHERAVAADQARVARSRKRTTGLHGRAAVQSWAIEHWVQLQRLNSVLRRGTELETREDRKKLIIARNRELALQLGVTNAELANLTHAERAALTALKAGGWPGKAIEGALRKTGAVIVRGAAA